MSKRKSDFHQLYFINPFDISNLAKMVDQEWFNPKTVIAWRKEKASKFIKDERVLDILDIDELITQWDVKAEERKCNAKLCNLITKDFCMVLRLIDAEHQDALHYNSVPGVVFSESSKKYLFIEYDLDNSNTKNATCIRSFDTEKEAYEAYYKNRNHMIDDMADAAIMNHTIDPDLYMKYFNKGLIKVRPYEYYKKGEDNKNA